MGVSFGLPRMHKEAGERRDFLPGLVTFLDRSGADGIVLEEGYGAGIGVEPAEYLSASDRVRFGSREECLAQDVVVVIRCPDHDILPKLRAGAALVSMLHFPTRPERVALLSDLGLRAVSLDSIVDEGGRRLVENLALTAWNGVHAAFREIQQIHPLFDHPSRRPLRVTCLGSGAVGGFAIHAATRYGDPLLREELVARNVPGVEVTVVDFDLTWHQDYMLARLERTDLLIDATQRRDPSQPVVPNPWIAALPEDGGILDLAVDPYDLDAVPPKTKGVEGIPGGDLDRYVFAPDDAAYDLLDRRIDTRQRRLALSCYSWPGLRPRRSMEVYGGQIESVLRLLLGKPLDAWDPESPSHEERAVARGELERWKATH